MFGPESVSWRVHADPVMGFAGLRALLLQALHPLAMAGVAQHSVFRSDPWGRLFRTAQYVGVTTYGTVDDAQRTAARVRGIHRRLRGIDPRTGQEFRLDDPELLRWVHCAEIESYLSVARRGGLALTTDEADTYVAEQVEAARLIGIDPATTPVPASTAELDDYLDRMRPTLELSRQAYEAAKFLLAPPMPRWVKLATPAVPAWVGVTSLGFALLPRWARRMYALPGLPTTDAAATATLRALRVAIMALPASVREGPMYREAQARALLLQ